MKPSTKREIRGFAVEVNIACWVVAGGWTWSKVKVCFLEAAPEGPGAAVAVLEPAEVGVEVIASIETLVDERALTTVLWKRAGMELVS